MKTAQEKLEAILYELSMGRTVYISSYTKTWAVTQKTVERFEKAGVPLFKVSGGNLWMARGRNYDCIDYCNLRAA